MAKKYTAQQAAKLLSITYDALRKQLNRDAQKDKSLRKYPNAYKCECGNGWIILYDDLKSAKNR
jgi:hypothetical protein